MNRIKSVAITCIVAIAVSATLQPLRADDAKAPLLTVLDEKSESHSINETAFAKLPRQKVMVNDRDGSAHEYEGALVGDLLHSVGTTLGDTLRGERLSLMVLVEAADNYRVAFSLAELDPSNNDNVFLLADRRDGQRLDDKEGPYRLIVPGEKRRGRWVRQINRLTVAAVAAK